MAKVYEVRDEADEWVATATRSFLLKYMRFRPEALDRVDRAEGDAVTLHGNGKGPTFLVSLDGET